MYTKGIRRLNAKLDAALAALHPFDSGLSMRLDQLLALEESAETPSEREFWRNLRERESSAILDIGGGKRESKRNLNAL